MKAALILAFLLISLGSRAETRDQIAAREAQAWMLPCSRVADEDKPQCKGNQADFLEGWLHARAGEIEYIREMPSFFGAGRSNRSEFLGIRGDWREAIAWKIVEERLTRDDGLARSLHMAVAIELRDQSPDNQDYIVNRADGLLDQIRWYPTHPQPPRPLPACKNCITTVPDD